MAVIDKFLGQRVRVPEDRKYHTAQGLWATGAKLEIAIGLSEPALVLLGGLSGIDWLVDRGQKVEQGQSVIFAITGKILYLNSPFEGTIRFNEAVKGNIGLVSESPYDQGWLFRIKLQSRANQDYPGMVDAQTYIHHLNGSEGFKNPDGLKGGVSGICKAVYSGIRDQEINSIKN